jgi:hypothetical protein
MTDFVDVDYAEISPENMGVPYADPETPSTFSLDYFRNKVNEFQLTLDELDRTGDLLMDVEFVAGLDEDLFNEWATLVDELEAKRDSFRMAAESINLASSGLNAVGVDFPTLRIGGLGVAPLVVAGAAIAAAVGLMAWAKGFWSAVSAFVSKAQSLQAIQTLPEAERRGALDKLHELEAQVAEAEIKAASSPLSVFANVGKWVLIAGVAFLGYKLYMSNRRA